MKGLSIIHKLNICHKDIKYANVGWSPSYNKFIFLDYNFTEIIRVYDLWQDKKNFREKERKKDSLYISVIEERIYPRSNNYFSKWRQFRLEYGGVHENCIYSGAIRVPPNASASDVREVLRIWQEEK